MNVEWKPVPNWPRYLVSSLGNVWNIKMNRSVRPANCRRAYITIYRGSGDNREQWTVNPGRLVLEAFIGPCPEGMECCHYDDNPRNNNLSNLRWDTHKGNGKDCRRNKRHGDTTGENNSRAIMTEEDVLEAKKLRDDDPKKWTYNNLGKRYGMATQSVYAAVNGRNWKHLQERPGASSTIK